MDTILWQLLLQLFLIFLNAIFACAEIAVISLGDARIAQLASGGDKRARKLEKLNEQPAGFLATIQIAITLSGFLGSAFAADNFAGLIVDWLVSLQVKISPSTLNTIAVIVITLLLSYITLVFGELVPKRLAMKKTERLALALASLVYALSKFFSPIVRLLTASTNLVLRMFGVDPNVEEDDVSRESISLMVDAGSEKGVIASDEKEIIQNLFEFEDLSVGEFATHRKEMSLLWMDESPEEWEATIEETRHSRYPVCDETTDNVVGVLYVKDYYFLADKSRENVLAHAVRPAYFVPETVRADVLFRQMKETRNHFAVVLDEYGGTLGIVTINDLLEQLVGDLNDDHTEEVQEEITEVEPGLWRIVGTAPLSDVAEKLHVELPLGEYDTFSGLVFGEYGSIPEDGVRFEIDVENLHVRVDEIQDHRLECAMVTILERPEEYDDTENDEEEREKEKKSEKKSEKEKKITRKTERTEI